MRYLAIDLGDKRTGAAVGDDVTRIVTPLEVIATSSPAERDRRLGLLIDEHGPDALVVGLPLDRREGKGGRRKLQIRGLQPTAYSLQPDEGPAAQKARAFAEHLRATFHLKVHLVDEGLTSFAAEEQLSRTGLTHAGKKGRRDALAAAVILRDFLQSRER
jgi:putative holliday junction resolvase